MTSSSCGFTFVSVDDSDVGSVRAINEDSRLRQEKSGLWLVADGMGGHAAGDVASSAIVEEMKSVGVASSLEDLHARFVARLYSANQKIVDYSAELGRGTVGSTVVALLAHDNRFMCVWSGDSRMYLLRGTALSRVSKDHTEVQALLDQQAITEEEAASWPRKNVITNAIGVSEVPVYEVLEGELAGSDRFLLCSDGLTEYFEDDEIESELARQDLSLEEICRWFVRTAVARGGKDNVTVVCVDCHESAALEFEVAGTFPEFGDLL